MSVALQRYGADATPLLKVTVMIRNAKDGCLEFDAAAFAKEAERIAGGGHFLPNEVGPWVVPQICQLVFYSVTSSQFEG